MKNAGERGDVIEIRALQQAKGFGEIEFI